MTKPPIVVSMTTLDNPNGAASDYALYSLDLFDGTLYAGGWLNGANSSLSNPNGVGLDRIYASSSPTLDDFSQVQWTGGLAPGTWNQSFTTLFDEVQNPGTDTYAEVPYYGPGETFSGAIYYQVNDPSVIAEGSNLVMYMTAVPNQNEYPIDDPVQPNGNPNYQLGWNSIGWALSTDDGATWTWEGALPLTNPDGTALLAPVTQAFPTNPGVTYDLSAAGNEAPTAVFNVSTGLDLWYVNLGAEPELWLSHEDRSADWSVAQPCRYITGAGTVDLSLVNPDVAAADDGSGTLWLIAQQWGGPKSGDLMLFYSTTADGAEQGIDWHAWDGADGVLVTATETVADGLYDLVTPTIFSVGNGSIDIAYSTPTTITPDGNPIAWQQVEETLILPCFASGTRLLTARGKVAVEAVRVGDLLPSLAGARVGRVCWIGCRAIDAHPVRVRAHALGPERPSSDLRLSADHAVSIDNVLVPVRHLVNGATIVRDAMERVTWWHVELERHDVLLAEGLACESYLDTGNRAALAGDPLGAAA